MRIPPRVTQTEEEEDVDITDVTNEAVDDEGGAPPVAVVYGQTATEGYAMRGLPTYAEARDASPINTRRGALTRIRPQQWDELGADGDRARGTSHPRPVFGTMGRHSPTYRGEIHAEPCRDMGPAAEYSREDLQYLGADFRGRRQVDEALARLGDISLAAEVRRYRASQEVIKELEAAIKRLEDDIFVHVDRARHSAKRLGRAHAILRWSEGAHPCEGGDVTSRVIYDDCITVDDYQQISSSGGLADEGGSRE
ncbi:hypothetical protein EI94DRAFT_1708095 [Lactarius quietus]|nr:hypothetical protein EI94DRAFT_1708095 [Lactarius quietus]